MTDKLTNLSPIRQPNDLAVAMLRDLLRRAEEGTIISVAAAYECADHDCGFQVAHGATSYPSVLVGELEAMKINIVQRKMLSSGRIVTRDDPDDPTPEGA